LQRAKSRIAVAIVMAVAAVVGIVGAARAAPTTGVAVSGDPVVGTTLQATWAGSGKGTWAWLRCADADPSLAACTQVAASSDYAISTYTVAADDVGSYLRAQLIGDAAEVRGTSDPVGPATSAPDPTETPTPGPTEASTPAPTAAPTAAPTGTPAVAVPAAGPTARPRTSPAPRLMLPRPIIRVRGYLTRTGAHVTLLTARAPAGARVRVRCSGRSCPRPRWARAATLLHLGLYERTLRAGTRLVITVTKPGRIGKHTVLVIRRGKAPARRDRCLWPGSTIPRRCPL
jgi:hypothetical protein